jgi:hypothetical protein
VALVGTENRKAVGTDDMTRAKITAVHGAQILSDNLYIHIFKDTVPTP